MIEKFISIKSIGRFSDCHPRGDVAFRKLVLLFAENGQGKTTLCAILRSLQSGNSEFISERKTLGTTGSASVQIRVGGNTLSFSNNTWSATDPDIAIFDSVFIHDNVYAGDYVDHEHKKNLYRIIVGAQGVQLAKEIDKLNGKIRNANRDIKIKKEAASRNLPNDIKLDTYLEWQPVEDIENKIKKKSTEITNRQKALEKAIEIKNKKLLAKITLPTFPSDFSTILTKQITDIIADAESYVRQQIADHQMGNQGEIWLSQGLDFVENDKCPFCGQDIYANNLITAYHSHFNATYKALKQEVTQLTGRITDSIGESALNTIQQTLSDNLTLVEFWKQFDEIELPDFAFDVVREKYEILRDISLELAKKKQQTPTESILPKTNFQFALDAVTALQRSLHDYNTAVDACNARINEQKTVAQKGDDLTAFKNELADLEAKKKRFELEVIRACQDYQLVTREKIKLEEKKQTAKEQLDQHCQQILQTYERTINEYLDQFNTGFRIINTQHSYRGGTPSSQFQIQINDTPVALGDNRTPSGTPCFKTTLSSGDRSALALAFFLAALWQDPDIKNKIVVLDDPFTSLDRFRRTCTQQLIRNLANTAQQVIVMSHDPHFLNLIFNTHPGNEIKTVQLAHIGDSIMLGEWDIVAETQSTYHKNYDTLLNFYRNRTGVPLDVARAIRPFLEGWLRARFPGHFQPDEWLGNIIEKIRNADDNSGLQHAQADLSDLEAINDYSRKYHHDQNPKSNSECISGDELHGFVKRTLRLVGGV